MHSFSTVHGWDAVGWIVEKYATVTRTRTYRVKNQAEIRHLPQKAVFGLYLEWYSSHPTKMHIRSFRTVHEWKSVGCSDGENRLDSRTLADHPQKCVGEGEIQFRGISCRIKPSIAGSGYEHRSFLSMR